VENGPGPTTIMDDLDAVVMLQAVNPINKINA